MANGGIRPNQTYGGSSLSVLQPAPSSSTLFPISSQTSPSYQQQLYEGLNNPQYSSLQSAGSYYYASPPIQPQPILRWEITLSVTDIEITNIDGYSDSDLCFLRMAMLPDEKYPDMSLHPTNSTQMLYGTLQKGKNIKI